MENGEECKYAVIKKNKSKDKYLLLGYGTYEEMKTLMGVINNIPKDIKIVKDSEVDMNNIDEFEIVDETEENKVEQENDSYEMVEVPQGSLSNWIEHVNGILRDKQNIEEQLEVQNDDMYE